MTLRLCSCYLQRRVGVPDSYDMLKQNLKKFHFYYRNFSVV